MLKIFIDKDEAVASVLDKILGARDSEVILVIPKGSELKKTADGFATIYRESTRVGKRVCIESVDDEALASAEKAGLEAVHSLFNPIHFQRSLSDILSVPHGKDAAERSKPSRRKKTDRGASEAQEIHVPLTVEKEVTSESASEESSAFAPGAPPSFSHSESSRGDSPKIAPQVWESLRAEGAIEEASSFREEDEIVRRGRRFLRKSLIAIIFLAVLFGTAWWVTTTFFGRAEIVLDFRETPWEYKGVAIVDKAVSAVSFEGNVIPGEVFSVKKNVVLRFAATGKSLVETKARGKIIIWNNYSTAPQQLVATTRFRAPDGKIFRLTEAVTVPGAKKEGGKLVPSSIEAPIIADKAGSAYNVAQIEQLTIPGFEGTPKYDGFYGQIKEPLSGGASGERAVPTEEDISAAKSKTEEALRSVLLNNVINGIPAEFNILEKASNIEMLKLTVDSSTDEQGKFSVFGEARLTAVGYRESDLKALLQSKATAQFPDGELRDTKFDYEEVKPDFKAGKLTLSFSSKSSVVKKFDVAAFQGEVLGKRISELKPLLVNFDGSVEVRIWPPIGYQRIPKDPARVKLTVK